MHTLSFCCLLRQPKNVGSDARGVESRHRFAAIGVSSTRCLASHVGWCGFCLFVRWGDDVGFSARAVVTSALKANIHSVPPFDGLKALSLPDG
jgi:hypothetical protein